MIKFFKTEFNYNWVSDNGSFIGYDRTKHCCEDFGYCYVNQIFDTLDETIDKQNHNKELKDLIEKNKSCEDFNNNLRFGELVERVLPGDMEYYEREVENYVYVSIYTHDYKKETLGYLVLFNCHNTYYHHELEYVINPDIKSVDL